MRDSTEPRPFGGVWSEFLPADAVRKALPVLAAHGSAVHLAWPAGGGGGRLELARAAGDAGVSLRPWLLLDKEAGYWAGAANATLFAAAARALMRAWREAALEPTTLIVDMEPAYARVVGAEAALKRGALREAIGHLRDAPPPSAVAAARRTYSGLVDEAHAAGWRVHLTTLPFVVDAAGGAQRGLRGWLGLPVDGPAWDVVSLQAYRTLFHDFACAALGERLGGRAFGADVVRAYADAARGAFGARAGIDLGLVGDGVYPATTYDGPSDLAADLGAAHAAGVDPAQIHVYGLDGILARAPAGRWWPAPQAGADTPGAATRLMRGGMAAMARLFLREG
jgi:hypothetical protein